MFWKKREKKSVTMEAEVDEIIRSLGSKWSMFLEAVAFKDEVPLSEQIELFASPAIAGILSAYPPAKEASNQTLWMMVFTAILESDTHPKDEVNRAIAELERKYANK